jgi:hypothetical protein
MKVAMMSMILMLACSTAGAWDQPAAQQESLQVLVDQQHDLQARMAKGDTLGLTPRQLTLVRKAQTDFFSATDGKSSLDQLSIDEKIRVENALQRINAEVVNTRSASDNQNVCWRERVSGTSLKKTRCGTKAEMREAREGARDYLERPKTCGQQCSGL